MRNIKVLIVGGGVAGLTLANLLKQQGIEALVLEKSDLRTQESGYYIGVYPNGSNILKGLDLYEKFSRLSTPLHHYKVMNGEGELLYSLDIDKMFGDAHEELRMLPRGSLVKLLYEKLAPEQVLRGARLHAFKQRKNGAVLVSYNNKEELFDLVVGADGIHSKVRELVCGKVPFRDTNWQGLAWYINNSNHDQHSILEYWAKGKMIGFYPYRTKYFCFAGIPKETLETELKSVQCLSFISHHFRDISEEVNNLLDQISDESEFYQWPLKDVCLDQWIYNDNTVLIGDSANAILPTAGAGVALAMESAAVLADELSRVDKRNLLSGLNKYETRHFDRVLGFQKISEQLANWVCTESKFKIFERDFLLKRFGYKFLNKQMAEFINEPY